MWRRFDEEGLIADIWTMNPDGTDQQQITSFSSMSWAPYTHPSGEYILFATNKLGFANFEVFMGRCCTARSKSLTSLCRLQSHPAQYVSGIPSAAILLSISHPIRCSTRCLANVRARISGPMIAL